MWAAQHGAEWAAKDEAIAKVSAGGLTRQRRGRRAVGNGRRRRRQRHKVKQRNRQQQQQQVKQEVQRQLDDVKWEQRQVQRWKKGKVYGQRLEQRRAIRVGGSRRSTKSNGSNWRIPTTATRGTAAPASARRCAARARLAQPSRSMRGVTHAWGMRLGGGGKRGWVT